MSEGKKLDWKKEDNDYLNKVFSVLNLILAFILILSPLITSFICLCGMQMDVLNVFLIFEIIYILSRIMYWSINFRFIRFKKLDLLEILGLSLLAMFLIASVISGGLNMTFMFVLNTFFVFLTIYRCDKKHYKILMYTFILTMVICSIMGLCDLSNSYMPGFSIDTFPMSLQFFNPNYSGYITTIAILLTIYVLHTQKKVWEQVVFWVSFVLLNVSLFINGCFSAETALFVGELFLIVYLWIKNKKCPYLMLICLGLSIASSFAWIKGVSTSGSNYMFEALSVIDNNLGTHLTLDISTFFNKLFHTGIIDRVVGSDGWDREDLKAKALREIFSNAKIFLFGGGAGYNYEILVHNVYIQIWLEYGIFNLLLYLSILACLVVRVFKTKFSAHNIFMIALMIAVVVVCHWFGCLDPYSFTLYVAILAVCVKNVNAKMIEKKSKQAKNELSETNEGVNNDGK